MSEQLYDDVVPFFIKLREHPEIQTVILTTGDEEFQRIKVHVTGVDSLVDEVFITRKRNKAENIREIIKQYQPMHTIFIDDHINISPEDFDTPITIYEMNRANTKL
jgi:FMN phosphatase YigB (HAD superfamily)